VGSAPFVRRRCDCSASSIGADYKYADLLTYLFRRCAVTSADSRILVEWELNHSIYIIKRVVCARDIYSMVRCWRRHGPWRL